MYTRKVPRKQQRVALYARVSSEMQAEEGVSIEAQLAEMREYAASREWEVVNEFIDAGISGRTLDRPGIQALLSAVAEDGVDIVLVHELSRLSRTSVSDTFAIFEVLGQADVGFASVKEPNFDLSTPTGRLMLSLISAINAYYVDMLIMHTKKSKRQRARMGLYNHSIIPYGYRPTPDPDIPPEIEPDEAAVVRLLFERYATGTYSLLELADLINDLGHRTRGGARFSRDTVTDMVRNPFYAGYVVYKEGQRGEVGEVYDGQHEPLVGRDLWERCREVRQGRRYASKPTSTQERPYLVAKLAHCHVCGRSLRVQSAEYGPYYREMSYMRGHDDCPHSRRAAHAPTLHEQISGIIRHLHLPADWQDEVAAAVGDSEEVRVLHRRRARLETERRRLKEAYIRGDFEEDTDIYRRELARIRREMEQLPSESDLAQIQHAASIIRSIGDVWDQASEEEQRDLVRLMLEEVRVDVVNSRPLWLKPHRPFVPLWRAIPILQERDMGVFTPVWPPALAGSLPYGVLPPITVLPDLAPSLPFLAAWPWPVDDRSRITEPLSSTLKERRKLGFGGGPCAEAPWPGVPLQRLDTRKWPSASLETLDLDGLAALPSGWFSFITTPLALQGHPQRDELPGRIYRLLAPSGHWHVTELVPAAMPGHWTFSLFPDLWSLAQSRYLNGYQIYNLLRQAGFTVTQREHVFYQAISLQAARRIAARRPGLLAELPAPAFQQGMARLQDRIAAEGPETLIGSEVALVVAKAVRG